MSGEPFPPSLREAWMARGIGGYQVYATADLGNIAYETPAREGLVVEEGALVEIVRPGTGDPVPQGEVGEVVVTTLGNRDYPLDPFRRRRPIGGASRDFTLRPHQPSHPGMDGARRSDDEGEGMFVHPSQVAVIVARHPEIARARLVVDNPGRQDRMTLYCEPRHGRMISD